MYKIGKEFQHYYLGLFFFDAFYILGLMSLGPRVCVCVCVVKKFAAQALISVNIDGDSTIPHVSERADPARLYFLDTHHVVKRNSCECFTANCFSEYECD